MRGSTVLLEFIGKPPAIDGKTCEGLICEGAEFEGNSLATANVTYLKFEGDWHRLCFDVGTVHWRTGSTQPEPWGIPEAGWNYPQVDVGRAFGLIGVRLKSSWTLATEHGANVFFEFENGRKVLIENADDSTSYRVV